MCAKRPPGLAEVASWLYRHKIALYWVFNAIVACWFQLVTLEWAREGLLAIRISLMRKCQGILWKRRQMYNVATCVIKSAYINPYCFEATNTQDVKTKTSRRTQTHFDLPSLAKPAPCSRLSMWPTWRFHGFLVTMKSLPSRLVQEFSGWEWPRRIITWCTGIWNTRGFGTRDQPKPTPTIFLNNTLQQRIYQLINSHHLIVLSMQKAINKAIAIKETALVY